jgi:hypothetical protein
MINFLAIKLDADEGLRRSRRARNLSLLSFALSAGAFGFSLFNLLQILRCSHG